MKAAGKTGRRYSWEDYRAWDDDQRWELIGGEAFCLSHVEEQIDEIRESAPPYDAGPPAP